MSSQRGNVTKGAPKHQNAFAFRHNKKSAKTEKILSLPNDGLCAKCTDIIEWKKKYRKYKPLTTARKCARCEQKTVTRAYHVVCHKCAAASGICAKCLESKSIINKPTTPQERVALEMQLRETLAAMSERQRRTYYRRLEIDPNYKPGDPWNGVAEDDDEQESSRDEEEAAAATAEGGGSSSGEEGNNEEDAATAAAAATGTRAAAAAAPDAGVTTAAAGRAAQASSVAAAVTAGSDDDEDDDETPEAGGSEDESADDDDAGDDDDESSP